jgi:16S rRNA C1402 N4-methylase RsmH
MTDEQDNVLDEPLPVGHTPVLTGPLLEWIKLPTDGKMADVTVGHGGHSRLFGQMLGSEGLVLGLDVDPNSLEAADAA